MYIVRDSANILINYPKNMSLIYHCCLPFFFSVLTVFALKKKKKKRFISNMGMNHCDCKRKKISRKFLQIQGEKVNKKFILFR